MTASKDSSEDERDYVMKMRPLVRLRLVRVVKTWVDLYWFDFAANMECRMKLDEFMKTACQLSGEDGRELKYDEFFLEDVRDIIRLLQEVVNFHSMYYKPRQTPKYERPKAVIQFLDLDPKDVAAQLTVLEHERFSQVRSIEFVLHIWGCSSEAELCNIRHMADSFNNISYWVATEICTQPMLETRAKMIENFIRIAKYCKKLNNYNLN